MKLLIEIPLKLNSDKTELIKDKNRKTLFFLEPQGKVISSPSSMREK
jgi:hypothetical protein